MNGAAHIAAALAESMSKSDAVHIVGEALPLSAAGSSLLSAYPDRCHLLPAADATLVGFAIGLALAGKTPVVELSGSSAVWGALQQLGQESTALSGEFAATIVLRVPIHAPSEHTLRMLDAMPHIKVLCPSDAADAAPLMHAAIEQAGVTVVLEPASVLGASGGQAGVPAIGEARCIAEGDHVTIAAWGVGVDAAQAAARTLDREGISAEIIDLRSLAPVDIDTLSVSVNKTGRLILVGANTAILNQAVKAAFLRLESPPATVDATPESITTEARAAVHY